MAACYFDASHVVLLRPLLTITLSNPLHCAPLSQDVITNQGGQTAQTVEPYGAGKGGYVKVTSGAAGLQVSKGDELARFELGSTVVLVFEVRDADFAFCLAEGEKIKLGEPVGIVTPRRPPPPAQPANQTPPLTSPAAAATAATQGA